MKVKLCGFTTKSSLEIAVAQKCDFIGFVFYDKSLRYITPQKAKEISLAMPQSIARVAVVVDADFRYLEEIAAYLAPDFFQFHGSETCEFLKKAREKFPQIKIIKAFKVENLSDLTQVKDFENYADLFLFDGKNAGSGKAFDWKILQNFHCKKDWFLSGGLSAENIEEALKITGANMIDISSGIEKTRGEKSPELIESFMKKLESWKSNKNKAATKLCS